MHELHQLGVGQAVALAAGLDHGDLGEGIIGERRAAEVAFAAGHLGQQIAHEGQGVLRFEPCRQGLDAPEVATVFLEVETGGGQQRQSLLEHRGGQRFEFDAQRHEHRLADGLLRGELGEDGFVEYALVRRPDIEDREPGGRLEDGAFFAETGEQTPAKADRRRMIWLSRND